MTREADAPSGTTILMFSLEPWDTIWRRNQYLIDGLLRADDMIRVIFVEPPRDVTHDILSGRRPRLGAGRRVAPDYDGRLMLVQPTKWLPRVLGAVADRMLQYAVLRSIDAVRATPDVIWVNDPSWAAMISRFRAPALYDMTDDWLAARRSPREHRRLVRDETTLMRSCQAVVVCSDGLAASRREIRPDLVVISNAVDVGRYRRPVQRPSDLPRGRVALYAGTLHEDRLDIDLVVKTGVAVAAVGGVCVFLGPNALSPENTQRLVLSPGVLLLGARPYDEVPGYLQHADALIVPHVVTEFTESLDPLKLYEYQAVARPIVSTPVAGFRENSRPGALDVVSFVDFPAQVVRALHLTGSVSLDRDVPDWHQRVRRFHTVLARLSERRMVAS